MPPLKYKYKRPLHKLKKIKVGRPICCECCGGDIYYGQTLCLPCFIIQGGKVEYCQCCVGCQYLAN